MFTHVLSNPPGRPTWLDKKAHLLISCVRGVGAGHNIEIPVSWRLSCMGAVPAQQLGVRYWEGKKIITKIRFPEKK